MTTLGYPLRWPMRVQLSSCTLPGRETVQIGNPSDGSVRTGHLGRGKFVHFLMIVLPILGFMVAARSTVQAQCPAPWYGASIYGTMKITANATTSDGSGGNATTDENDLISFKMSNPVPCEWSTANYGAMGGSIVTND